LELDLCKQTHLHGVAVFTTVNNPVDLTWLRSWRQQTLSLLLCVIAWLSLMLKEQQPL